MGENGGLTPEDQLLVLLSQRLRDPEAKAEAVRLAAGPLSWADFVRRAIENDVYPMVAANIESLPEIAVPSDPREELAQMSRMNALRMDIFAGELATILRALDAAAVPAIPLKGVTLALSLYGDPSLRACGDIDILVPLNSMDRAIRALKGLGFEGDPFDRERVRASNLIEHYLSRYRGTLEILVELHWAIMWGATLDRPSLDSLWRDSRPATYLGVPARSLSPEWELIFLAGHAARSGWSHLKWLVDIAERSDQGDIDWEKVARLSRGSGWDRAVRLSLGASKRVLGRPSPPGDWATKLPAQGVLFPKRRTPGLIAAMECADPSLLDSLRSRWRFLASAVFAPRPRDYRIARLPEFLVPLGSLYRPFRLASLVLGRLVAAAARRVTR